MKIHCTNEILMPPDIVFPWIAEPKKAMRWQKHVTDGEIITSVPEVVGTTFKETLQEDGNELEMTGVITQFSPDNLIAFHLTSRIHEFDMSYALEGVENRTRLSIEATIRWKFPMNIFNVFVGSRIEKRLTEELRSEIEQLKRICEAK